MADRDSYGDDRYGEDRYGDDYGDSTRAGANPGRKRSWRERIFSNQTARWVASGAPYHSLAEAPNGRLADAASEFGWQLTASDEQASALLSSAPFRVAGYVAGNVVRGQFDPFAGSGGTDLGLASQWQFVAFDALDDSRLGRTVGHCFTAVPTMIELPPLRVLPARYMTGPSRGMQVFPTVDPIFDARFKLLAANGDDELAAFTMLMTDEVRSVLSAGDDREEIWTIEGHVVVSTSRAHDEELLARHLEICGAMLRAIRGA
ncbi:MAG: hypothetical protein ACK5MR_00795 [Cumulibacter sp.]